MARPRASEVADPVLKRLDAIQRTLQDLLVVQGAQAGIGQADIRQILEVGMGQVTRVWKTLGKDARGANRGRRE